MDETVPLIQSFNFVVRFIPEADGPGPLHGYTGGFAECSGLELDTEIKDYPEGGRNDGLVRRVGRVKLVPLVLKRGMFITGGKTGRVDTALWDWITAMIGGHRFPRYGGEIDVLDPSHSRSVATWHFARGLPSKVTGPTLNAKTGEVAIEELHIVHEALWLEN